MDQNFSGQNSVPNNQPTYVPPPLPTSPPPPLPTNNYQESPKASRKFNKKLGLIIVAILLIVGLPLTIYLTGQRQDVRQRAAEVPDTTVVGLFDDQPVTKGQVREVALEQYDPKAIDSQALRDSLNTLVERKILDREKSQNEINVSQKQTAQRETQDVTDPTQAYYDILRDRVIATKVKNWKLFTIGFWVPPTDERSDLTTEELKSVEEGLSDGLKALSEAEVSMESEDAPLDIAKDLVKKYPSLEGLLAVNGYLIKGADSADLSDYTSPKVYQYESSNKGQVFFDSLYAMDNSPQIKKVLSERNSGGNVIQLIEANPDAEFDTYDSWLAAQKPLLFKEVYNL